MNAIGNKEIENYGIPCIYYHGIIIGRYNAFAMTLFEGTLEDRYQIQKKPLSELTVTLIMKQAVWNYLIFKSNINNNGFIWYGIQVQTLSYLALKRVVHNDIILSRSRGFYWRYVFLLFSVVSN